VGHTVFLILYVKLKLNYGNYGNEVRVRAQACATHFIWVWSGNFFHSFEGKHELNTQLQSQTTQLSEGIFK